MRDPGDLAPADAIVDMRLGPIDRSRASDQLEQCHLLTLAGECDVADHLRLRAILANPVVARSRALIVDMTRLTFIDAGCVGLFLHATLTTKVVVMGSSGTVARVLDRLDPHHHLIRAATLRDVPLCSTDAAPPAHDAPAPPVQGGPS